MSQGLPPLPEAWTSNLLRRLTPKETLTLALAYDLKSIAERLGDDEFVSLMQRTLLKRQQ